MMVAMNTAAAKSVDLFFTEGDTSIQQAPGLGTYARYQAGDFDVVLIVVAQYDFAQEVYLPPSPNYDETGCQRASFECLIDVQFSLWNYLGPPEYPFYWLLLDDTLVVQSIANTLIEGSFDDLDARLELMLADDGG